MARYDKYDPKSGGFRAEAAAAWVTADLGKIFAVGINSAGRAIKGPGVAGLGLVGVVVVTKTKVIGEILDVMTAGEIVEAALSDGTTAIAAGVPVYAVAATGLLTVTATANIRVGYTIEGGTIANTRLIVRMGVVNPVASA
jgi:hypothetical protein